MTTKPCNDEAPEGLVRMLTADSVATSDLALTAEHVLQVADSLRDTSSPLAKQRIIKNELMAWPHLEAVFYLAMSKEFTTYIGDTTYYALLHRIEDTFQRRGVGSLTLMEVWPQFEWLHTQITSQVFTGGDRTERIHDLLVQCTKTTAEVLLKLLAQNLFENVMAVTVNKAMDCEIVPIWGVQLCKTYNPAAGYAGVPFWWATPKLNGFRATYKNGKLFSRSGKWWSGPGFNEIAEECAKLQDIISFNLIDGELCTPAGAALPLSFQNLSSILRNSARGPERVDRNVQPIYFNIFAGVNTHKAGFGLKNTGEMYQKLREVFDDPAMANYFQFLRIVPAIQVVNSPKEILQQCRIYTQMGYEGIVLRHPYFMYNSYRSSHLLKYKFFHEMDLTIIDAVEGTGKYASMLGALVLEAKLSNGNTVRVSCGTGFDDSQRMLLWAQKDTLIGRTVAVKYQDLTDADLWQQQSLSFPVFIQLKD